MKCMNSAIEVSSLCKTYPGAFGGGAVRALREVSMQIQPGEAFGLLGPNGAGKTTLVKCLMGIVAPTSGTCQIFGLSPADPKSRQSVGYLPENHRFPRGLTGGMAVMLAGRLSGMDDNSIRARADVLLERLEMAEWANTRMGKYSKGMAQRLAIIMALIGDPDLLALDEPSDGVDSVGRAEIAEIIRERKQAGKTTLLNSHALAELEQVCDRVAMLNRGRLVALDSVANLTRVGLEYTVSGEFGALEQALPSEIGETISFGDSELVVRLVSEDKVDQLTDWLRDNQVHIRALQPRTLSLEEVFLAKLKQDSASRTSESERSESESSSGKSSEESSEDSSKNSSENREGSE